MCILEDNKLCEGCCDCNICDLDSDKICDNCAQCIQKLDYNGIRIDKIEIGNLNSN